MKKVTEFFVKNPTIFWSLMVGILIAGVLAFIQMPKLEDPAVSAKQAMVVVVYPGASAHEVELNVAQTVENELKALPDVNKIKTECQNGQAIFTVEFKMTVLNKDLEQHFDLVRRKANDLSMKLPQGCYAPIVIDDMMDVYGIFYAVTGDGFDYNELDRYAKYIKLELSDVKGVKRINIAGNRSEVINITLSKEMISRNGIIPTQIMATLQSVGKPVNAGKYASGTDKVQIRISNPTDDVEEIRNTLISTMNGKQMRLGDIAKIEREYATPQTNGFFVNNRPAIAVCITMEGDAIVPDVGKAVDQRLAETMTKIPAGINVEKIFFQPDKVDEAISSFMVNLVESVAIVILVLIFTMGFRSGVIIGFGLVLTVAVSFPILLMMGTTLQRISLGAFIVAMGMLVDNAIVIMDGILVDKKRGLAPKTYLYRIGQNTALPLLGATIIAASTFLSVYLSPDSAGEYAKDLFLVLCVSLLASWFLALIQVPVCAKSWLPAREKAKGGNNGEVLNSPVHRFVRRAISFLIDHKKSTIATAFVLLGVCIFGMTKVKNLFFPDFDYKQFIVECYFPAQSDPDYVRDQLFDMTERLRQSPKIERVASSMGGAPAYYCLARPMTSGGECYGELMVDCKDYNTVVEQIPAVRELLRKEYPDAYIRIRKYNFSISTSHTVEAEFSGPDPAVLKSLSHQAEEIMRQCEYVDPYSVQNNWKPKSKNLTVDFLPQNALSAGITRNDVAQALLAATDGQPVGVLNDGDKTVPINLLVRNDDGSRIDDLDNIPVWSMMNVRMTDDDAQTLMAGGMSMDELQDKMYRSVPLSSVARDIKVDWEEQTVRRLNGRRAIEAECDPNPYNPDATPAKVMSEIQDKIESIPLPDGYKLRWAGEGELQGDAVSNILKYVPLTIFIILVALLLLFNSWKKVLLILICFPFVFCGITPALLGTGQPFTFMAIIGLIGLIGMMCKNAIVLVDEINRRRNEEHEPAYDAVVNATVSRVRPVIMASLTTIVGMIPLVTDPMYGSMAITIMGGLTVGTIITLILLPILYTALFHVKKQNQLTIKQTAR
ncbi:MAG TPA: efflux RND transporter permease subunit [Candidatus Avibacteroides faecavium]|nr:efflux RND transporter permease subunit [Candidatus Avibacteroides faecavium]